MQNKKVIVAIGSGPASVMALSVLNDEYEVFLIEKPAKNFILGKRILVSGNGRANFFNEDLMSWKYASDAFKYLTTKLQLAFTKDGKLYYPYFNRSECLHSIFDNKIRNNKSIHIVMGEALKVNPLNNNVVVLENGKEKILNYDYLIFAPGGRSYDRKDFNYNLLNSLKVKYRPFESCLCPIRTVEKIPSYLNKNRLHCTVSLYGDNNLVYKEEGEVLFKEDGLSGICIFNSTVKIRETENKYKNYYYKLDYSMNNGIQLKTNTLASAPSFLKQYLKEKKIKYLDPLIFNFKECYSFEDSQISFGGILQNERDDETFVLKKFNNIYALGETIDHNFFCGGYNIGVALTEGYICGKDLLKKYEEK